MIRLKDILTEIRAKEAYRDEDAIQTVIDGRRDLGFITVTTSPYSKQEFFNRIDSSGLNVMQVPENPYQAYIYYRTGAEEQALELRDIALRYGGFLAYDATADETRRIGELLGYDREDIARFVAKNYPGYQYPDFTGIADTE